MTRTIAVALMLTGLAAGAAADEPPGSGDPRFLFFPGESAVLRLDLQSGTFAACTERDAEWVCADVPDERAALGGEIMRLRQENALLRGALRTGGIPLPARVEPMPDLRADATAIAPQGVAAPIPPQPNSALPPNRSGPATAQPNDVPPPSPSSAASKPAAAAPPGSAEADRAAREDADIERAMNVMEKVWRRLVNMMISVQREMQKKS